MVYTDGVHLVADTVPELHEFAKKIGLKRCWYHEHAKRRGGNRLYKPHYDLMRNKLSRASMFGMALEHGAKEITDREIVLHFQKLQHGKQTTLF